MVGAAAAPVDDGNLDGAGGPGDTNGSAAGLERVVERRRHSDDKVGVAVSLPAGARAGARVVPRQVAGGARVEVGGRGVGEGEGEGEGVEDGGEESGHVGCWLLWECRGVEMYM